MNPTLIFYGMSKKAEPGDPIDLVGLASCLLPLVGEPFLFTRMSYGDELTLHAGARREAKNARLRAAGLSYGSHILSTRGSAWLLKPGTRPVIVASGAPPFPGQPLTKAELDFGDFISEGARVIDASAFPWGPGFGAHIAFSDGSAIVVRPTPDDAPDDGEAPLSPVVDWELMTPQGTLRVGPGLRWEMQPASKIGGHELPR